MACVLHALGFLRGRGVSFSAKPEGAGQRRSGGACPRGTLGRRAMGEPQRAQLPKGPAAPLPPPPQEKNKLTRGPSPAQVEPFGARGRGKPKQHSWRYRPGTGRLLHINFKSRACALFFFQP
ncbi:hypothetical protein BD779DRAFT_1473563 [Infundibulicybe gibba]|nr:hypothetical protein BD779DRAFT_1473563 [Infundibulicybe gibba]